MKFLAVIIFLFFASCEINKIEPIEISFIQTRTNFPMVFDCSMIQGELMKERIFRRTIDNQEFLKSFLKEYESLKEDTVQKSIDIRIQVLIKNNNSIDTLCLGEYFNTSINGKKMIDNPNLLKMLKNELNYDNIVIHPTLGKIQFLSE